MLSCGAFAGEHVNVADIKITFANPPVPPPPDAGSLPREALYPPDMDSKEHGPFTNVVAVVRTNVVVTWLGSKEHGAFTNVVASRISAVTVTWADPKRFKTEKQTEDFLRELLSSTNTQTWTYHIWSYGDGIPSVLAAVEHTAGKQGKWVIWCSPNLYWAYQDQNGKWWWGMWDVLKAPRPKSMEASHSAPPSESDWRDLESRCRAYHLEHHREDEQAAGVLGQVELMDYTTSVVQALAGEALVKVEIVAQKSLLAKGLATLSYLLPGCLCWQERWSLTKDGWVFVECVDRRGGGVLYTDGVLDTD
jgi:hypothetical protein